MNTSVQAAGGRHLAPADPNFPFRIVVWEHRAEVGWRIFIVFEERTFADAEFVALDLCTEPYADGVTDMHYVIGEVANG